MPSVSSPFGLKPEKQAPDANLVYCLIPSSDSHVYGVGDPVSSAGSSGAIASGSAVRTVTILQGTSGPVYGVIVGFDKVVEGASWQFDTRGRQASINMYCYVQVARPQDRWLIQANGAVVAGDINQNAPFITIADAGANGQSVMALDISNKGTTATLAMRICQGYDRADNALSDAYPNLVVRINNCEEASGTGTVGL